MFIDVDLEKQDNSAKPYSDGQALINGPGEFTCSICYEDYTLDEVVTLVCSH
jgi:hypothetical protein